MTCSSPPSAIAVIVIWSPLTYPATRAVIVRGDFPNDERNLRPGMNDRQQLFAMRASIVVFSGLVLAYAIAMEGTSIYELVSSAYQVPLVGAFTPLVFGLYWKRATTQGAILSVAFGLGVWILFFPQITTLGEVFPGQLAGLIAAIVGMVVGSLAPQVLLDRQEPRTQAA